MSLLRTASAPLSLPGEEPPLEGSKRDSMMLLHRKATRHTEMRQTGNVERTRGWVVDYSEARAKAIAWLGDRYLLAKPINGRPAATHAESERRAATTHGR